MWSMYDRQYVNWYILFSVNIVNNNYQLMTITCKLKGAITQLLWIGLQL